MSDKYTRDESGSQQERPKKENESSIINHVHGFLATGALIGFWVKDGRGPDGMIGAIQSQNELALTGVLVLLFLSLYYVIGQVKGLLRRLLDK
jgi:hypothetical protein